MLVVNDCVYLIDFVNAYFKYDLNVKEDLEYNYKYKIVANVNVIDDSTHKSIYTFSENILEEVTGQTRNDLKIQENVKIDYNKYNDLISEFVNVYNLNNVTSKLSVNMYVGIAGTAEDFQKEDDSVISLDIPLTTNTVAIDVNYDLSNNVDSLITLKSSYKNSKIFIGLSIIFFVADIVLTLGLIKYIKDSETEEEKYNSQLILLMHLYLYMYSFYASSHTILHHISAPQSGQYLRFSTVFHFHRVLLHTEHIQYSSPYTG